MFWGSQFPQLSGPNPHLNLHLIPTICSTTQNASTPGLTTAPSACGPLSGSCCLILQPVSHLNSPPLYPHPAQNHAHKLEDAGRLVALLLVSPDALAHQHKSDFEGKAYEVGLVARRILNHLNQDSGPECCMDVWCRSASPGSGIHG